MHCITRNAAKLAALAALATCAAAAQAAAYNFTTIAQPGTDTTAIWDVNNSGQIAGNSQNLTTFDLQAFVYSNGVFTTLTGPLGSISTTAFGITDNGTVVGSYYTSKSLDADGNMVFGPERSYIFNGSSYTTIEVAGATQTQARGVSPDGRYVAGFYSSDTVSGQGFVFDTASSSFAFVGGGGTDSFTIMQGINSSYTAVGSDITFIDPIVTRTGIIYDIATDSRTDVVVAGAVQTAFRAIDDTGVISGWYNNTGAAHGFTGYPGAIQTIDVPGADSTFVQGSNNNGILVGQYRIGDRMFSFVATPVPEPETWALMLGGIAVLALRRRR